MRTQLGLPCRSKVVSAVAAVGATIAVLCPGAARAHDSVHIGIALGMPVIAAPAPVMVAPAPVVVAPPAYYAYPGYYGYPAYARVAYRDHGHDHRRHHRHHPHDRH
jgi:hypothetical protein